MPSRSLSGGLARATIEVDEGDPLDQVPGIRDSMADVLQWLIPAVLALEPIAEFNYSSGPDLTAGELSVRSVGGLAICRGRGGSIFQATSLQAAPMGAHLSRRHRWRDRLWRSVRLGRSAEQAFRIALGIILCARPQRDRRPGEQRCDNCLYRLSRAVRRPVGVGGTRGVIAPQAADSASGV